MDKGAQKTSNWHQGLLYIGLICSMSAEGDGRITTWTTFCRRALCLAATILNADSVDLDGSIDRVVPIESKCILDFGIWQFCQIFRSCVRFSFFPSASFLFLKVWMRARHAREIGCIGFVAICDALWLLRSSSYQGHLADALPSGWWKVQCSKLYQVIILHMA